VDWHNQRGQAENLLKELKHGVGRERMPCGESYANAVWFRLGVIAYNLLVGLKRLACPHAWTRHTISTLRWMLLQVAGRIVHHAGQVVLRLVVEAERLALLRGIRQQCWALSGAT
jgi:Transposase DDE domain group 1